MSYPAQAPLRERPSTQWQSCLQTCSPNGRARDSRMRKREQEGSKGDMYTSIPGEFEYRPWSMWSLAYSASRFMLSGSGDIRTSSRTLTYYGVSIIPRSARGGAFLAGFKMRIVVQEPRYLRSSERSRLAELALVTPSSSYGTRLVTITELNYRRIERTQRESRLVC